MKILINIIIVALILTASAYGRTVPRLALQCETSRPSSVRLDLVHGETVDLAVRLSNYGTLLDITGATVTLHARTNNMAEGSSWQVPGEAGTNDGIASVSLDVDAWIPRSVSDGTWTIEIVQPSTARILRAGGILRVADTAAASTNDPVPSLWLTDIRAEIADAVAPLATTQHVADAVAPLITYDHTNRVTRLQSADGQQWMDSTGVLWRVSYGLTTVIDTNRLVVSAVDAPANESPPELGATFVVSTPGTWTCGVWAVQYDTVNLRLRVFNAAGRWATPREPVYPAGPEGKWRAFEVDEDAYFSIYYATDRILSVSTSVVDRVTLESEATEGFTQEQADARYPRITGGTATNLTLAGWLQLPQTTLTNLVLRLVCSNDHIIVQEVYQ